MQKAPIPDNEVARLTAVKSFNILDTPPEERFDKVTKAAIEYFKVPIATITIMDADREWFKSCQGLNFNQADRSVSFCGHAMLSTYIFIVEDTLKDQRFMDNPQVIGAPYIRFYAGMAMKDKKTNLPVGVLCIKDTKPRTLSPEDIATLIDLAGQAEEELNKPQV